MNTVHLIGAEEVSSAASRMVSAAAEMRSAAGTIDEALHRHAMTSDERVMRLERAAELNVRAAIASAEIEAMKAHNAEDAFYNRPPTYTATAFVQVGEHLRAAL